MTYSGTWQNGIDEAAERLTAHLSETTIRFDARDREALRFLIWYAKESERLKYETR